MKVVIQAKKNLLESNTALANKLRQNFFKAGVTVFNLMSSPGAGKTTLLEETVEILSKQHKVGVIEGDVATDFDAERIARKGVPVIQVNTGSTCHLDASMIADSLDNYPNWQDLDMLFIENVGNLLCPATFDLGEKKRIVLLSTPEGEDKPLKYPLMFQKADMVLITKIDLAEVLNFDRVKVCSDISKLNPKAKYLEVSSQTGEGISQWLKYLVPGTT